jgi:hypothetical protein
MSDESKQEGLKKKVEGLEKKVERLEEEIAEKKTLQKTGLLRSLFSFVFFPLTLFFSFV